MTIRMEFDSCIYIKILGFWFFDSKSINFVLWIINYSVFNCLVKTKFNTFKKKIWLYLPIKTLILRRFLGHFWVENPSIEWSILENGIFLEFI
jgi:hypothetical protein